MKTFTYGSVCSGIEAVTCAWHDFAACEWLSEIEAFPSAVLAHHYPTVPNLGDMTKIKDKILSGEIDAPDVLVGGTPCQAFSVAGERKSLDDERGQLTLAFIELADAIDEVRAKNGKQPTIILWENVPGVLSTKDNAFGCLLGGLARADSELQPSGKKWGNFGFIGGQREVAWRVLDSQHFGVPQRRRRVFVVASARGGANVAEVLFERKGLRGDTSTSGRSQCDATVFAEGSFAAYNERGTASTLKAQGGALGGGSENFVVNCFPKNGQGSWGDGDVSATITARGVVAGESEVLILGSSQPNAMISGDTVPTLTSSMGQGGGHVPMVTAKQPSNTELFEMRHTAEVIRLHNKGVSPTLTAMMGTGGHNVPLITSKLRKLTPVECERLQGFPDNYTQIPYRNKPAEKCADTPRYKAIGNSMTVQVMRWIGKRIEQQIKGWTK